jgi:glycogen debranching enzyme
MNHADEEDRHPIHATASLSSACVLRHGDMFALFDRHGDIRPFGTLGAHGLYHDGTRFLSALRMSLGGERLLLLSSNVRADNVMLAVDLMSPDLIEGDKLVVPHGTLHALRAKFLWQGVYYERIQLSNFGARAANVALDLEFMADFADVFEVRGTHRARRGTLHESQCHGNTLVLSYTGLDGKRRTTRVALTPAPTRWDGERATFRVELMPRQSKNVYLVVTCEAETPPADVDDSFERAYEKACAVLGEHAKRYARIHSSNEQFNDWLNRSIADLRMMITETDHGQFPYAGVPWFSVPFGRDAVITAFEALWLNPELARGVLGFLAANQADTTDASVDAEPGKIVHEMRGGEMAALREIPFGRYYGSVDSTPLFVMLAAAYHQHTGDLQTMERLWPQLESALGWIEEYGDVDGDGFVEYGRQSKDGLTQQGWKDSHDSVFHADGTLAQAPIALAEVQGYVYAARHGAARIAAALGHPARAKQLADAADRLQASFDRAFWCEDLGMYALALDGAKRPCRVQSSNAGQCLFTGIALPERAATLATRLGMPEMFSGWGIRTLAVGEQRYNPLSYHNGSVWPHDNALIAAGLARYGHTALAARVLEGLFDASLFVDLHRLPELFCGFPRRPGEGPTLYPVACSPQAWAAGTPFLLLQAILGMSIDGARGRLSFVHPTLPPFLKQVTIRGLRVGDHRIDIALHRHPEDVGINVLSRSGPIEVATIK